MRTFYIILLGLSGGYLLLQLAVHLLFGRPLFPNAGELFEHTKSRAEWQTVFPKNLLRLIVFVFVTSLIGLLLDCAGAVSWLGLPLAAAGGLAFNFLLSTVFSPMYLKLHKQGEPSEKELENMDGVVTEEISPDMYGEIKVTRGGEALLFPGGLGERQGASGGHGGHSYLQRGQRVLCGVEGALLRCAFRGGSGSGDSRAGSGRRFMEGVE